MLAGIGVGCLGLLSMCPAAFATETFKIGLIADYTGAFATWGPQFQNAIEAFQATYGKSVNGPKVETIDVQFVYRDAASAGADKAKQLAEELILRDKVRMIAGFDLSPHALAVAPLATEAKVPLVVMNAAAASITRASPYIVRTSATLPQAASTAGEWAAQNGYKKVFIITSDYAPGNDAAEYFAKSFKAGGGEVVGSAKTPLQETNFAVYMERMLQAKPDLIYMFQPNGSPSIAFVKAYLERGLKQAGIQLMGGAEFTELYLPNFSDEIVGTLSVNNYTETNALPENKLMRDQLTKIFGPKGITDIAAVGAWDGMQLIYLALKEIGANGTAQQYIDAMKGKELRSPRGPIMIDPIERDIVQNIYMRRIDKVDGKLMTVDIATVPMVKDPWKIDNPVK
jgi:branched-chain amino acid transport system substrate-binding protein